MKRIYEVFTDEEFKEIQIVKNGLTWRQFMLEATRLLKENEEWKKKIRQG